METRLTEHFTLEEMTRSAALDAHNRMSSTKFVNAPSEAELANLKRLCECLERVRKQWGMPLVVNSGYRSRFVNGLVGGSKHSYHLKGLAADLRCESLAEAVRLSRLAVKEEFAVEVIVSAHDNITMPSSYWLHFAILPAWHSALRWGVEINGTTETHFINR